ncbi:MAG TPA: ABC transporter substrate-binding protein, partial [Dehalococcoidia bacterium]|nr:ABC transporter substrate-binding protein [Dehalococcoidia bacterium]
MTRPARSGRPARLLATVAGLLLSLAACTTGQTPSAPVGSTAVAVSPPPAGATAPATAAVDTPRPTADTPAPAAPVDREVVLAVSRDLVSGEQDPFFAHSSTMTWESLVALDDQLNPVPQLAESWDLSADGTTWTFKLRSGVRFSDGTPFDADAVVANVQRYLRISPRPSPFFTLNARQAFGDLVEVAALDDLTVVFRHNAPNPSMPFTMSNFFSAMYSPNSFAENGDFAGTPATTGPFVIAEWQRGQYVRLDRNEAYWGAKPAVRQIRLRVLPDSGARVSALLAREVDGVVELGALLPSQAKDLEGRAGITVGADPISISQFLAFNCSRPPFDNADLRRAVALAIDREAVVRSLVLGYGVAGQSLLSPFAPQWLSPKGRPAHDPAEARDLARAALGDRRVSATLIFAGGAGQARPYRALAELFQSQLAP